jgi:hypothetical protein
MVVSQTPGFERCWVNRSEFQIKDNDRYVKLFDQTHQLFISTKVTEEGCNACGRGNGGSADTDLSVSLHPVSAKDILVVQDQDWKLVRCCAKGSDFLGSSLRMNTKISVYLYPFNLSLVDHNSQRKGPSTMNCSWCAALFFDTDYSPGPMINTFCARSKSQ